MKKVILLCLVALFVTGCSLLGNIDEKRLEKEHIYLLNSGQNVTLPLRYKNWKWMMATYSVPAEQIEKLLPAKLKPVLITQGKALISFGVLEYPQVSELKPYDEWLVSIPVQYEPDINIPFLPLVYNPLFPHEVYKKGGSYIYYLPVTTTQSHQIGSEIWGFPKVHRQIKCIEESQSKTCHLMNNGKVEMSLIINKLPVDEEKKKFAYCSYTEKNEELLRTCVIAKGNFNYTSFGQASISFSKEGIGAELAKLELEKNNPIQVFQANHIDSILPLEYERLIK